MGIIKTIFGRSAPAPTGETHTVGEVCARRAYVDVKQSTLAPELYVRGLNLDRRIFLDDLLKAHPDEPFSAVLTAAMCDKDGRFVRTADDFDRVSALPYEVQEELAALYVEATKAKRDLADFFAPAAQSCAQ